MSISENDEEREWQQLMLAEFLKGYAESDAIYDDYYSRPPEDSQTPNAESD